MVLDIETCCARIILGTITKPIYASFLDDDYIPTYGDEKPEGGWKFSGYRKPTTRYYRQAPESGELEEYKVKPRGLYKSRKFGVVNSDLNGAANTLRKEFPDAFSWEGCCVPDFSQVEVFKHPDHAEMVRIRRRQQAEKVFACGVPSRSKFKRDLFKGRVKLDISGNPSGIRAL